MGLSTPEADDDFDLLAYKFSCATRRLQVIETAPEFERPRFQDVATEAIQEMGEVFRILVQRARDEVTHGQ